MAHNEASSDDVWMSSKETSKFTGAAPQTLANWRWLGIGPPYSKLSCSRAGRVRYRRSDVEAWLMGNH